MARGGPSGPAPRGGLLLSGRTGRWRTLLRAFLGCCTALALLVGVLKLADLAVSRRPPRSPGPTDPPAPATMDLLELFPFDGFHVKAHHRFQGTLPTGSGGPAAAFEIRTGDKGYLVDFPLENPPPKAGDEFRIVVTGGDAAQGWGASGNDRVFSAVLERLLGNRFAARGIRVRVFNLAMATSTLYQNFLALNQWGHALEPDLILAYAGRNDFAVPLREGGTDRFLRSRELGALVLGARRDVVPPRLGWLFRLMPNTMRHTRLGLGLKIACARGHLEQAALANYVNARGPGVGAASRAADEIATPLLVHALASIERDFEGVPILLAWEPAPRGSGDLDADRYGRMFERARRELAATSGTWHFVDVHELARRNPLLQPRPHLDDDGHAALAGLLAERVAHVLPTLLADRAARVARGLPAGSGAGQR